MGTQSEKQIALAYQFLAAGNPKQAKQILEDALTDDLENKEIIFGIRCCSFWIDTMHILPTKEAFEQGEMLVNQWKSFQTFISRETVNHEKAVYATCRGVFSLALAGYQRLYSEKDPALKAEAFRKSGLCYKKLGEYEMALESLQEANKIAPGTAAGTAEMADCYALYGDEKLAKLLFREAFFIDARKIDLNFLDSELICLLIRQVALKGYNGAALQEWIPVYGVLFGVFNVKRELSAPEVGKLKQEIFARENEAKNPTSDMETLTPRLINLYFWLIDHYVMSNDSVTKINEVLLKIKLLAPEIHAMYVK